MTNEEAIKFGKNILLVADKSDDETAIEFTKLAIKALETIPKYKDAYGKGWVDGAKASYEHLKMCEEEQEPCRETADYENEIEDLHNRLDIAEYDKEMLREEATRLEERLKALEQEPCEDCIDRAAAMMEIMISKRIALFDGEYWIKTKDATQIIRELPRAEQEPKTGQYEKHIDHTDCLWYGSGDCPVTCSQYRDGWNDAMDYIYKDGKGYQPYRHDV